MTLKALIVFVWFARGCGARVKHEGNRALESERDGGLSQPFGDYSKRSPSSWNSKRDRLERLKSLLFVYNPRPPARNGVAWSRRTALVTQQNLMERSKPRANIEGDFTDTVLQEFDMEIQAGMNNHTRDVSALESGGSGNMSRPLSFQKASEILKEDISQILVKDLNWDVFDKDFRVIDRTGGTLDVPGAKLQGIKPAQRLCGLARKTYEMFTIQDDVRIFMNPFNPAGNEFVATGKVQLSTVRDPFLRFWLLRRRNSWYGEAKEDIPIDIEVETVFHLNSDNKVEYVRVDKWLVNGRQYQLMPDLDFSEDFNTNLGKLRTWAEENVNLLKINKWAKDIAQTPSLKPTIVPEERAAVKVGKTFADEVDSLLGERRVELSAIQAVRRLKANTLHAENQDYVGEERDKYFKRMHGTYALLDQMESDIKERTVEIVALVSKLGEEGDSYDDVFAIAATSKTWLVDDEGMLRKVAKKQGLKKPRGVDGRQPVLDISEIVAAPSFQEKGFGKELIFRLVRREARLGTMVMLCPTNKKLEEYYGSIGFVKIDRFGNEMFFASDIPVHTEKDPVFDLGKLKLT